MESFKALFAKHYPQITKARKFWVTVVSVVIPAIIFMIIVNLAHSKDVQHETEKEGQDPPKIESPQTEDLSWYKNPQNLVLAKNNKIYNPRTNNSNYKNDGNNKNNETEESEKTEKAMKAAITTNQITSDSQAQTKNPDYLEEMVQNPRSPYELQAGSIIPAVLITGINSDLPGQITAQVTENVYDSISGNYLVIPQGTKVVGQYDAKIIYGQERVLVVWKRLIFVNGKSLDLEDMPATDLSGYAGFTDKVNNHYSKIVGAAVLMSIMGAGAQLSQPQTNMNNPYATLSLSQLLAQNVGVNLANTGNTFTQKNINIQPTLEVRPGYRFNISVVRDCVF